MRRAGNEESTSIADIVDIIEHQDELDLLSEIENDEYYARELCGQEGIPAHLRSYFYYEAC